MQAYGFQQWIYGYWSSKRHIQMSLNAQIIEENGEPKFAVLPYTAFQELTEALAEFDSLEDFLDYLRLLQAKAETKSWHSRDEIWPQLGLEKATP